MVSGTEQEINKYQFLLYIKGLYRDLSCPLNNCITLGKLFNLNELSFLTCQMEIDNTHFMKVLKGLKKACK